MSVISGIINEEQQTRVEQRRASQGASCIHMGRFEIVSNGLPVLHFTVNEI